MMFLFCLILSSLILICLVTVALFFVSLTMLQLKEFANFDFDVWRKKYMRWMNHKKSRVMDFFRRIDKDQDGKITRQEFIDGILASSMYIRFNINGCTCIASDAFHVVLLCNLQLLTEIAFKKKNSEFVV